MAIVQIVNGELNLAECALRYHLPDVDIDTHVREARSLMGLNGDVNAVDEVNDSE
jgi:hypothetical protein